MANDPIKMRLMGTKEDLERWLWFVGKMQDRGLATIIEKSPPYKNRGESLQHRVYLEVDLLLDAPDDEIKPL
ncbi:hypothetical protein [Nostoc sp. PA-18-2419]|uniref:hypothetical protein n=1 Tax=Nostoc sp. PA-18-2419 TaxID=2575443 RepID=UPI0011089CAB|nr:hypothetical protein [Nostoc sp. PA-18-2419]